MERLTVKVTVDRPIGYQDKYGNLYPINYGFVAGVIAGDGEEQDAYILNDSDEVLTEFVGTVIAVVHRKDDVEDKWVVAQADREYSLAEIEKAVAFMEQYFDSEIELL